MSSPNQSTAKSELETNHIEEENSCHLVSHEEENKYLNELLPNLSLKNFEPKKEIFEFNSHEVYWSTENYFRIIYFKLNEIKQFKDSKIPAEFKNIPIEFSETNRKMNMDIKFEFDEESFNFNLKFTNFLKENNNVNKEKLFSQYDEEKDSHVTPDETYLNIDCMDKDNKVDISCETDQMRSGSKKSSNNKFKKGEKVNSVDFQEEVLLDFNHTEQSFQRVVNVETDDINHIDSNKDNGVDYCDDQKSSLNNNYEFITSSDNILRGRAKKNSFKITNAKDRKNKKANNNNINLDINLNTLQTLELTSDLTYQEINTQANNINNRKPIFTKAPSQKVTQLVKGDETQEMDSEINFNDNNKAIEGKLIIENDLYKTETLYRPDDQNNPNTIENLYSDDNNENHGMRNYKNSNANAVENKLKRITRARKAMKTTQFIDLTCDKEDENTANMNENINSCNYDISNISSTISYKNFDCKSEKSTKNKLDNRKKSEACDKISKNTLKSQNIMDSGISEKNSEEEAEKESYKKINNIDKLADCNIFASERSNNNDYYLNDNSDRNQKNLKSDFILERLEKYEINPLARNDEDPEELNNEKYSRVIQNKSDFLNLISEEDIKFDLKINNWNQQKKSFAYLTGKKLFLKKRLTEYNLLAKYEDIIFDSKDFYLVKLIFSSKKKAKPANKIFCGIQNEKNTCYLNSIFQILFNLKLLRKQIFNILSNEGTPLFLMQQAFFEMQKQNKMDIRLLGFIRAMGWDESVQNDFTEIFFFIFEMLSEHEKSLKGESQLNKNCTGIYRTHIKCNEINYESIKPEPFLLLQLDISGCKNLIQCFENFLSVEKMTEENKYELEDRSKHEAIKSLHFEALPPILFISLTRFEYKEQIMKKFDKVEYEEFIDLGNYIMNKSKNKSEEKFYKDKTHKYELYGVVVHDGNAEGGHYYTFFKENKSRNWIKFNDSKTMYVSEKDVFENNFGGKEKHIAVYENGDISVEYSGNSRTAYILVYLQKDKIEEILADVTDADVRLKPNLFYNFNQLLRTILIYLYILLINNTKKIVVYLKVKLISFS